MVEKHEVRLAPFQVHLKKCSKIIKYSVLLLKKLKEDKNKFTIHIKQSNICACIDSNNKAFFKKTAIPSGAIQGFTLKQCH